MIDADPGLAFGFKNLRGHGIDGAHDGIRYREVLALYSHVNALASPLWAENLVLKARAYQAKHRQGPVALYV